MGNRTARSFPGIVISLDLEYTFDVSSKGEALVKAESVKLPDNCVENSFKIIELESYEDFEEV